MFVQLLAAAGVDGIVAQHLSRSIERRQVRGSVREALSEVERLRWTFDLKDDAATEFRGALSSFKSAALIAGCHDELWIVRAHGTSIEICNGAQTQGARRCVWRSRDARYGVRCMP